MWLPKERFSVLDGVDTVHSLRSTANHRDKCGGGAPRLWPKRIDCLEKENREINTEGSKANDRNKTVAKKGAYTSANASHNQNR